jgi:hypothetical protein
MNSPSLFFQPHHKTYWHSLNLQIQRFSGVSRFKFLLSAIFIVALTLTLTTILTRTPQPSSPSNPVVLGETSSVEITPFSSPSPPGPSPTPNRIPLNVASLTIEMSESEPSSTLPPLAQIIANTLQIASASAAQAIKAIGFDTLTSNPYESKSSKSLLIVVDPAIPLNNTTYQTEAYQATLSLATSSLAPYLMESKFCASDQDCLIRTQWCTLGAYNRYQPFVPGWYCNHQVNEENEIINTYSDTYNCVVEATYSGVLCQGNRCSALDPIISCQP